MLLRTNWLVGIRFSPACFWAHMRALNVPADPGMAAKMKRNFPQEAAPLLGADSFGGGELFKCGGEGFLAMSLGWEFLEEYAGIP